MVPSCKVDFNRDAHASVPAVSHPSLPGAMRRRSDDGLRPTPPPFATSACFSKAGSQRPRRRASRPHGGGRRRRRASKKPASLRDLITTVEEMDQKQKMAAAEGDDTDIFAYYAEPPLVAVNLFHLRNGHIVDRREFFWEDQIEFDPRRVLLVADEADLSRSAVHPGHHPCACRLRRSRGCWKSCCPRSAAARSRSTRRSAVRRRRMLALVETNAKHSFRRSASAF